MSEEPGKDYWIGFDLGGTKMLATVYDADFKPRGRRRRKTRGNEGAEAGMKRIARVISEALEDADIKESQLAGIGIGCPGPVDPQRGLLVESPNLGWNEAPVRDVLRKEFGCEVVVVNDVDAGIYGEYRFGAARDVRCTVGIFPGTGIGGGCVYDGHILHGRRLSCMEIGHTYLVSPSSLSGRERRGTFESVASRLAVAAAAAQAAHRGEAPGLLKDAGTDLTNIRSGALADSVAAGDEAVERILREAAGYIGTAIANVVHLLAPEIVVLGGGMVEALPELFVDIAGRKARKLVLPAYADSFRVKAAALGDDAVVLGAAAWAREEIARDSNVFTKT